jgi:hypothetical protein
MTEPVIKNWLQEQKEVRPESWIDRFAARRRTETRRPCDSYYNATGEATDKTLDPDLPVGGWDLIKKEDR